MSSLSPRRPCHRDVRLNLIGPITLVGGPAQPLPDVPRGRAATLLGLLAARRNRVVGLHTVIDTLWPDEAPPSAVQTVAALISRLRRLVGQCLERVGPGYRLDTTGWRVDLDEAAQLLDTAERRLAGGEPALAEVAAWRALDTLTAGQAAEGLPTAPWTDALEREVEQLLRRARHAAWSASARVGDHRRSAEAAAAALRVDPYDESACRALIGAQLAIGSPGAALRTFDALRRRLRSELGTEPDPRTMALHQALLGNPLTGRQDPPRPAVASTRRTSGILVGRDAELDRLHGAWRDALAGRSTAVLVRSADGMGRTALLAEFGDQAARHGAAVLQVRCADAAHLEDGTALTRAVSRYGATAHPRDVREAAAGLEQPLRERIPELRPLLGPVDTSARVAAGIPDAEPDVVAAFVLRTAVRRPVLLTVDDAHLADGATLATVRKLYAAAAAHRLLLVVAVGAEGAPDGLLPVIREAESMVLGPLSAPEVAELAARHDLTDAVPDLLRLTAGRPALLTEALSAAARGPLDPARPPDGLLRVAGDLVRRLGEPVADLLRQAAITGPRFRFEEVANTSGLPAREIARRLERALRAGVLRAEGETLAFACDALHTALSTAVPPPLRAALTTPHRPAPHDLAPHHPAPAGRARATRSAAQPGHRRRVPRCGCRPR
ncbi:BTAD domain-containing putative transcriptional regulator [Streptomyces sp. NPDC057616]|uniref:BTAD domain-containing putative transcriptional regulator n=1 Tax=Streptomyces sp. NPDC057616 TaxID=3346183 RepID=UPI0036AB8397